jgi:transcriptional regulator with XRE-family HTH domain
MSVSGVVLLIITLLMEIGKQIRLFRKGKGLKQGDLAGMIDKTPDCISQIERGVHYPTLATLDKICDALGVDYKLVFR